MGLSPTKTTHTRQAKLFCLQGVRQFSLSTLLSLSVRLAWLEMNQTNLEYHFTHCSLVDFSTLIYWKSPFGIKEVLGLFGSRQKLQLANSGDPDQTPHDAASDVGLHCLPVYPF